MLPCTYFVRLFALVFYYVLYLCCVALPLCGLRCGIKALGTHLPALGIHSWEQPGPPIVRPFHVAGLQTPAYLGYPHCPIPTCHGPPLPPRQPSLTLLFWQTCLFGDVFGGKAELQPIEDPSSFCPYRPNLDELKPVDVPVYEVHSLPGPGHAQTMQSISDDLFDIAPA